MSIVVARRVFVANFIFFSFGLNNSLDNLLNSVVVTIIIFQLSRFLVLKAILVTNLLTSGILFPTSLTFKSNQRLS